MGTSLRRSVSSTAWTDQAILTGAVSSRILRIASGVVPTVERVTCRGAKPRACGSQSIPIASFAAAKLSRGSPMPMKTTFVTGGSEARRASPTARTTCPVISPTVKPRSRPMVAVTQKMQPRAQPACEETHTVVRSEPGIRTVSIFRSSERPNLSFRVPHPAASTLSSIRVADRVLFASRASSELESAPPASAKGSTPSRSSRHTEAARPEPSSSSVSAERLVPSSSASGDAISARRLA